MQELFHSVAVVGAVIDGDRALCIERADNGHWEAPAGILERDETLRQGVVREVLEETGVRVRPLRVTGIYQNHAHPLRPVTIVWLCEAVEGSPTTSSESVRVVWLTREQVVERMTPAHALRLLDAWGVASEVVVRSHNGIDLLDLDS